MNEREAQDAVRPSGNVTPLPRMQEPRDRDQIIWDEANDANHRILDRTEPPYPDAPLASRSVPFEELTHAVRQPGALSGVRLWMTWPGEPDMAEHVLEALRVTAETLGLSVLDVQIEEMEESS